MTPFCSPFCSPFFSPFCVSCEEVLNECPLGVLCRTVDEDGRRAMCARCRGAIWRAQRAVQSGAATFAFENPNARGRREQRGEDQRGEDKTPDASLPAAAASPPPAASASAPRVLEAAAPGWLCRRCGAPVAARPRAFEGGAEPADWWWCRACQRRGAQNAAKSAAQHARPAKRARPADAGCQRLDRWLARGR
jgi:hypothetical protein